MDKTRIIQQGEVAKFQVQIKDFDMEENDFRVELVYGYRRHKVIIEKAQMLKNGGTYYFTIDTAKMVGRVTARCVWFVPDGDLSGGLREKDDDQYLCFVVTTPCPQFLTCPACTDEHQVTYTRTEQSDKKKERNISVLPYEDRCVQNAVKDAIEPLILRQMTDDMLGGLPGCGVLASDKRHQVVARMRVLLNDRSLTHYLQGDISKFYDHVDNVISMELIERQVKDKRTRAVIRQHLFNQKRLAIGDPFSHLIANLNMSVIIRKAKEKYGKRIELVNFADDFIAFSRDKKTLNNLRRDMRIWARQMRLHYKPMYVRPIDAKPGKEYQPIIFCGYQYGRGFVHLSQQTKQRYVKARHRERSMGSYKGIIEVADTKELKKRVQYQDNRTMSEKIRRPFAGRPMKIETMEGIPHTIVDFQKRSSNQKDCDSYYHIQALADGLGLIVYSTGAQKICKYLDTKTRNDIPLRDMKIVHDWSGFYYDGTVYTDAKEEEMIRKQFNIPK